MLIFTLVYAICWHLVDPLRIDNVDKELCTWIRGRQYSRLDYLLCSAHFLNSQTDTKILCPLLSDNLPIQLRIGNLDNESKGKG